MNNDNIVCIKKVHMEVEDAEAQLERNYEHNRKIVERHVANLAAAMRKGEFDSMNGERILVDEEGTLFDGQHRLLAQVKAGVPMDWLVMVVKDGERSFMTVDGGVRRSVSDYFDGKKNRTIFAAVALFGYCIEYGRVPLLSALQGKIGPKENPSRHEVVRFGADNEAAIEIASSYGRRLRRSIGVGAPSAYGKFAYLVWFAGDPEYLDGFVEDFCDAAPDCKTVSALKTKLLKAYSSKDGRKPDNKWLIGNLLDAYAHYSVMDDVKRLVNGDKRLDEYDRKVAAIRQRLSVIDDRLQEVSA